ncbi:hypothetical protein [Devosia riboflavina]|nr:hypothetical protein [Devosia riboflavina]
MDSGDDITAATRAKATQIQSQYGLPYSVALSVARGRSELSIAVERYRELIDEIEWTKGFKYVPGVFTPRWDMDPSRYYLSRDGMAIGTFATTYPSLDLLRVQLAELMPKLHFSSSRAETPLQQWEERDKTRRLGYRWHLGRAVSPPLLNVYSASEIAIAGGMHRVHLAFAEGAQTIPALVETKDAAAIHVLLPNAIPWV